MISKVRVAQTVSEGICGAPGLIRVVVSDRGCAVRIGPSRLSAIEDGALAGRSRDRYRQLATRSRSSGTDATALPPVAWAAGFKNRSNLRLGGRQRHRSAIHQYDDDWCASFADLLKQANLVPRKLERRPVSTLTTGHVVCPARFVTEHNDGYISFSCDFCRILNGFNRTIDLASLVVENLSARLNNRPH